MLSTDKPSWDDYFMRLATVAATRSNCLRRRVGAIIVVNRSIVSTGYNGTPFGTKNCDEGGCPRCASDAPPFTGYDACLCMHAEANAISLAARRGTAIEGGTLYCTLRPCFGCLKGIIQAGIHEVVYGEPFNYQDTFEEQYVALSTTARVCLRSMPI